jgi:hypothetical protein
MAALERNEIAFIRILLKGHVFFFIYTAENAICLRDSFLRAFGAFVSQAYSQGRAAVRTGAGERRSGR